MPTQSIAGLLDSLLAEVNILATRLNRGGDQHLFPSGARRVLQVLGRSGSRTVPEIARQRHTSRQNIQTLVNRLRKSGSVQVSANAAHKRSVLVDLTDAGMNQLRQIQESEAGFEDLLLARIPKEQLESATMVLRTIRLLLAEQFEQVTQPGKPQKTTVARPARLPRARAERAAEDVLPGEDDFPVNLL